MRRFAPALGGAFAGLVLSALAMASAAHAAPVPTLRAGMPVLTAAERASLGRSVRAYYSADAIELRLARDPAHRMYAMAVAARSSGAAALVRSGVSALDRVAALLGGASFAPEFPGESVPARERGGADFTRDWIVHLPPGTRLDDALARFAACAEVERVTPLAVLPLDSAPNDSLYAGEWWLHDTIGHGDIDAELGWNVTTGDTGVVVAVIDAGVLPYHADLSGTVAGGWGHLWTNAAERNGVAGVDDDGDGLVDDVWGWDFVDLPSAGQAEIGEDWRDADGDPNDMVGHGTACAGLIGALTDNVHGMAGVDWHARIMSLRVGWAFPGALRGEGEVRMDFAAAAIRYATLKGARVLNMSFSNLDTDGLGAAVTDAVAAGVVVVVSSGNSGSPSDLALRPDVISVAASDRNAAITSFSNLYAWTTLVAPGKSVQSLWSAGVGSDSLGLRTPAYSPQIDGTSFSAPLVSGAAALLESQRAELGQKPLDACQTKLRLVETARDIGAALPLLDVGQSLTMAEHGSATAMAAPTIGPAAVIPLQTGGARIACVTADTAMVMLDGRTRDTLWVARLADLPVTGVAAAQMNAGYGVGLFCGTAGGTIEGFDVFGHRLAGFPTVATGVAFAGGPALGDLDGDGALEIVCGADDGTVMAWHANGSDVAGWPRMIGSGRVLPVALADLDAQPGVEVIAACDDGHLTVLRGNGGKLSPAWPRIYAGTLRAPVVDTVGVAHDTCIVFTEYDQLHVLSAAAVERAGFPLSMGGPALSDLAVSDLDGDTHDDFALAIDLPPRLVAFLANGAGIGGEWQHTLTAGAFGTPVIAPFPGATQEAVLIQDNGPLLAFDQDGDSLHWYRQSGLAGTWPTVADVDGDGIPEVVAGTGADLEHHFYMYTPGPFGVGAGYGPWPTARGNVARTGSRLAAPTAFVPDLVPPARVHDLSAGAVRDTFVVLHWTATGDDSLSGRAAFYDVRVSGAPLDDANFEAATNVRVLSPSADAGAAESLHFGGLAPGSRLHFALRAVDPAGNRSLVSNDIVVDVPVGGPIGDSSGFALAPRTNPALPPLAFYWHGDPAAAGAPQRLKLYDVTGRLRFDRDLGGSAGGIYAWDGRDDHGSRVGAGVYFVRLNSGPRVKTVRIVLLP